MLPVWLGLDVGTTGVRCIAFDGDGLVVANSYVENPPSYGARGRVEQNPEEWFDASIRVIAAVIAEVGGSAIQGLAISSQGISVVPVDTKGCPLRDAIIWLDERGESVLNEMNILVDSGAVVEKTGKPWSGVYTLPKIFWIRRNEPEIFDSAAAFLQPMDYLHLRLVGEAVTDHTLASATMAYSLPDGQWDGDLLDALGIAPSLFPGIRFSGEPVGLLRDSVASELGCPPFPIYVGGQDQKVAAFGAGIGSGISTLCLGTSGALESVADAPTRWGGPVFAFLRRGAFVREAAIATAGAAHRWYVKNALPRGSYDRSDELAAQELSPGAPFFFARLSDQNRGRWPKPPSGVFWGLQLGTGEADLARCVYEGIAFEVASWWEQMGLSTSALRVFGGGARSEPWCEIIAHVLGQPTCRLEMPESSALGAAMLAGLPKTRIEMRDIVIREDYVRREGERFEEWKAIRRELYGV